MVDLGLAPGGWSQVVRRRLPNAAVAGIDLLPVDPIEGVSILQMDFMADEAPARLTEVTAVLHVGGSNRAAQERGTAVHFYVQGAGEGSGGW